jgi:hypothetical protein
MLDMFPYFMMFGVFCFMAWLVSIESDRADKLKAEKSDLIKLRNIEVKELRQVIRELRNCYGQNDKCTIWECNCI